ncbi:MAG: ral nucleoside transport system permease protein [Thermotogota bacterium]|nr:ral nucleoside transport system permease protein [Thermotogota bacterium]MDK2864912.1 ral nucleoside transport system permease protein [Thermotogota bacterium]HCZ06283.1 ABC transporter permease [Thermotogota bacterium]
MRRFSAYEWVRTAVTIGIALALGYLVLVFTVDDPNGAFKWFLWGPLSRMRRIVELIDYTIPLIFAGLAVSIVFQAEIFNIGAEGQLFMGAVGATFAALYFPQIPVIHVILVAAFAMLVGGAWASIPAYMKAKWNASELVSSLMMNYVAFFLGLYFINYHMRDLKAGYLVSYKFPETAWLPRILKRYNLHAGVFIAVGFVFLVWFFLYRTRFGYEIRMMGFNKNFAMFSGIKVNNVVLYAQIVSGMVAGLAGAVELMGLYKRFVWQVSPGYGFDGIIVALLARNNPLLVLPAAFLVGYFRTGAYVMSRMTGIAPEIVTTLQAVIILLITAEAFLEFWKRRKIIREAMKAEGGDVQ